MIDAPHMNGASKSVQLFPTKPPRNNVLNNKIHYSVAMNPEGFLLHVLKICCIFAPVIQDKRLTSHVLFRYIWGFSFLFYFFFFCFEQISYRDHDFHLLCRATCKITRINARNPLLFCSCEKRKEKKR